MKRLMKPWVSLAGTAIVSAACGGGGGGDSTPPPADPLEALPSEATQSVSGWLGYLDRLVKAQGADTREGFEVSATGVTTVPGDDAGEPMGLVLP
jgi:hypothetical protein